MEVRGATVADLESMIEYGRTWHAHSLNARYKYEDDQARMLGVACIMDKNKCAFVAVRNGSIVGILLGMQQKFPYARMQFATDLAFHTTTRGAGRKLLARFEHWAMEERKVDQILLGVMLGGRAGDAADALYARAGFTRTGGLFIKQRP